MSDEPAATGWRTRTASLVDLGMRLGVLLLAYSLMEQWTLGLARLPEAAYEGVLVFPQLLLRAAIPESGLSFGFLARGCVTAAVVAVAVARPRRVLATWQEGDIDPVVRIMVAVPTVILAWAYAAYPLNHFFGQVHLIDRVVVMVLAAGTLWRPAFAIPFAVAVAASARQLVHPMELDYVAEPFGLLRVLILTGAFVVVRSVWQRVRPSDLVFLVLTLVAAGYVVSGLGKIRLDWFAHGLIGLMVPATYANGWLAFLEPAAIEAFTNRVLDVDVLMLGGTFAVEILAVFALVRRRLSMAFLLGWIGFHGGVLAISGIFFWKWMVFEAALFLLFLLRPASPALKVFTTSHALLSVPLILGGTIWFHPTSLTWHNAAASYSYRFEAVGESGRTYSLPPAFFAPYDHQFGMGNLGFLSPYDQLPITWGATSSIDDARLLLTIAPGDLARIEAERGRVPLQEDRARNVDRFVERFVRSAQEPGPMERFFRLVDPPPHIVTFARGEVYRAQEPIVRVVVHQVTSFFDDDGYHELHPRELRVIDFSR